MIIFVGMHMFDLQLMASASLRAFEQLFFNSQKPLNGS